MSAPTYYVMHCVDFDSECLVANRPTFEAAVSALLSEHARAPEADLSVWRSDGVMLVPDVRAAKALAGQVTGHGQPFAFRLSIGRRHTAACASLSDAATLFEHLRDESGEGASSWPDGRVVNRESGERFRISYNGRVWNEAGAEVQP